VNLTGGVKSAATRRVHLSRVGAVSEIAGLLSPHELSASLLLPIPEGSEPRALWPTQGRREGIPLGSAPELFGGR
jgi:hypothetical protein